MKLSTTCSKNEQKLDSKNTTEFYTKWTKTTWRTFEETKMMLKQDGEGW